MGFGLVGAFSGLRFGSHYGRSSLFYVRENVIISIVGQGHVFRAHRKLAGGENNNRMMLYVVFLRLV